MSEENKCNRCGTKGVAVLWDNDDDIIVIKKCNRNELEKRLYEYELVFTDGNYKQQLIRLTKDELKDFADVLRTYAMREWVYS